MHSAYYYIGGHPETLGVVFPGEDYSSVVSLIVYNRFGLIAFVINGNDEPNTIGKDQFLIAIGKNGIIYDE